jgi:hypothetical protein
MGSLIDLLALLDGWDYREVSGTVTVKPGEITEVFAERIQGWLMLFDIDATDAFTHIIVKMPPETFNIVDANFAELAAAGFTIPITPALVQLIFNFPSLPADSSGFGEAFFNLVYPLPMRKNDVIHVQFTLDPGTTQASATVDYVALFIQIMQPDVFQKSLRDLYKGNLANLLK